MAEIDWLPHLPYQPLRKSLNPRPPKVLTVSDMDGGNKRWRRTFSSAYWPYPITWPFNSAEFQLFRGWYMRTLNEGANWFNMPLWYGDGYEIARCHFPDDGYDPKPAGLGWDVTTTLDVESVFVLSAEELNDRWPGTVPDAP